MESTKPSILTRRILWGAAIFLALIGVFAVARRTAHLAPILIHGYSPPAVPSNPKLAQFATLDDVFARYPVLTMIHNGHQVMCWIPRGEGSMADSREYADTN